MDPIEYDGLLRGFLFGMRVMQHAHSIEPGGAAELRVLHEIVKGDVMLTASPPEFARQLPGLPADVEAEYAERFSDIRSRERRDAQAILSGLLRGPEID